MSVSDTGSTSGTPKPGTGTSGATGSGATTSGTSTSGMPASGGSASTASTNAASTSGASGSGTATSGGAAAARPPAVTVVATKPVCKSRGWIFFYNLLFVGGLAALGVWYLAHPEFLRFPIEAGDKIDIAIRCMFFGALGGVVISLKGVYDHHCNRGDWDDGFMLWHIGRPISGALTGLITVVLLLAINSTSPNEPVAYAIAFIFGTQERRFFNFLSEVAALVVRVPGDEQDTSLKAVSLTPLEGKQGTLVIIGGQGFREGAIVTFGSAKLENAVVSKDGRIIAGTVPAGVAGGVDVTVTNPDQKRVVLADRFTYTA